MPESVKDRFSKKHEFMFFFVKNKKYYFDLDSIRDKYITKGKLRNKSIEKYINNTKPIGDGLRDWNSKKGKNPGDVSDFWDIPLKPSKKDHYASYNNSLINKPIIAGCPKGGVVLDPFCGSGTTLVEAIRNQRLFIGIDGNLEYCKQSKKAILSLGLLHFT